MTIATDLMTLVPTIDDSHAALTESYTIGSPYTYRLGTGNFPTAWQVIPKGAPPVPAPAAPATISDKLTSIGNLPGSGTARSWCLTYLTQYGESASGASLTHTVAGSNNAVEIAFPTLPNAPYNPIRGVGIYRSVAGTGGTKINVGFVEDMRLHSFVDYFADNDLTSTYAEPGIVDTSGLASNITVSGPLAAGGSGPWSQKGYYSGMTINTEEYAVSYLNDASGGTVYFSSSDNGKTVTLVYTGAIALSAGFVNSLITGMKSIVNGLSLTENDIAEQASYQTANFNWYEYSSITFSTGGSTRVDLDLSVYQKPHSNVGFYWTFLLDGTDLSGGGAAIGNASGSGLYQLGTATVNNAQNIHIRRLTNTLSPGVHTFKVLRRADPSAQFDLGYGRFIAKETL